MKITKLSIERLEEGFIITTSAFFSDREEVEEGDIARLAGLMAEAAGSSDDDEKTEDKPKRRGRRKAADAETKDEDEKPKRRGRRKAADAEDEKTEDKPKRKRRTAKGISDEDVSKAASEAAQELGPELVTQILQEDHQVDEVSELDQDGRKAFMATLVKEMEAE